MEEVKCVCDTDATVLLLGESGVGKEVIAKAIHYNSKRKKGPFIAVNCGAIPVHLLESEFFGYEKGAFTDAKELKTGKFEQADGGTILLDEIGELPLEAQVKLLRVIEDRKITRLGGKKVISVNFRVITATNRNLEKMIHEQKFRLDLFYRLNIFTLSIPPLRERKDDIPLLTDFFIQKYNEQFKLNVHNISRQAMELLSKYNWPGNIRDLENAIQSSMILVKGETILKEHLPLRIRGFYSEEEMLRSDNVGLDDSIKSINAEVEKKLIMDALNKFQFNRTKTAGYLRISRKTLFNKMKQYDIF
jgi:transcriptional regulator with PAS, ATPase and Fis domain